MFLLALIALPMMEKVLDNIVALVKRHPAGIPLKKLAVFYNKTYHQNLTLSLMGFNSINSLVTSLDSDLVIVGQLVLHKDHCCESQTGDEASAKASQDTQMIHVTLQNVVAMIKEHPEGIPLKMVAIVYSQKYHQNLTLTSLGFKTISCLVESLTDIVMSGDLVFHRSHQPSTEPVEQKSTLKNSRPATPQHAEAHKSSSSVTTPQTDVILANLPLTHSGISFGATPLISTTPLLSSLFTASQPAETLTQQELYQRIIEVS